MTSELSRSSFFRLRQPGKMREPASVTGTPPMMELLELLQIGQRLKSLVGDPDLLRQQLAQLGHAGRLFMPSSSTASM